jgi:hypothetical protein
MRLPRNKVLIGSIGEEHPNTPGVYNFVSTDGFSPEVEILSPDADNEGGGQFSKPAPGSMCIVVTTNDGANAYVVGFARVAKYEEDSDEAAKTSDPESEENIVAGDKVWRVGDVSKPRAQIVLKSGGALLLESGAAVGISLNSLNNTMSLRSMNMTQLADGYRGSFGRKEIGKTDPETVAEENFYDKVGPSSVRVKLRYGDLDGDAKRELTVSEIKVGGGATTGTIKSRETHYADGSWIGEGSKYQWGSGADEPMVLGNALVESIEKLIDIVTNLTVNTAWGPSTPPLPPTSTNLASLKQELSGKILSTFLFLSKEPTDPGLVNE